MAPGPTIQWEYDNCLLGSGTDDPLNPEIIECAGKMPPEIEEDCERNLELKRRRCRAMISDYSYLKDVDACLRDPNVVGDVVRGGGIGG